VIAVVVCLCINLQLDVVALNSIFPCLRNISSHFLHMRQHRHCQTTQNAL